MAKKKTNEQFLKDLYEINKNIIVLEPYINSKTPILCKCKICGYEWPGVPNYLLSGIGCPCCAGMVLVPGKNDLESTNPDIAAEWHFVKNYPLLPSQVFKSSNKNVYWICENKHVWPAIIGSRTRQNSGCPYCGNRKVLKGFNDLKTVNPVLANDWDYENNISTPDQVLYGSRKSVNWKCQVCGHKWPARINDRNRGSGCPKCKSEYHSSFPERAIAFYLSQQFDVLQNYKLEGMEIDVYLPTYNIAIEYDGKYYHNSERSKKRDSEKRERLKELGIHLIIIKESNKDMISGNVIWCHYKRSYNFIPLLIENVLSAIEVISKIHTTINVDLKKDYSKILAQYISSRKEKSLASVYPQLVQFWDQEENGGLAPEQISYGSDRYYSWKCEKNHKWSERIANLVRGDRCPYCSGHKASDENNLLSKFPEIAAEWHPTKNGDLNPKNYTPYSNEVVWWLCSVCENEYQKAIDKRTCRNSGCKICGKRKMVETQINDKIAKQGSLLDNYPEIAKMWHPDKNGKVKPENILAGSHYVAWWICPNCKDEHEKEVRQKVKYPRCKMCNH